MTITKAEFVRQMVPGLKLKLISNMYGDDGRVRTVVKASVREVSFRLPAGEMSWIVFIKGMSFTETGYGYLVNYDNNQQPLEYHRV